MMRDTVVVDIDGCLNYYPNPLKMWAEVLLNLDSHNSKRAIEKSNDFNLVKETYRKSEIFKYFLPRKGVKEFFEKIKSRGHHILLLTSRNPDKNPNVESLTREWLDKCSIPFDTILFTKNKSENVKQGEDKIIMVIEDEPDFLDSFDGLNTEIVVFKNELNEHIKKPHFHSVSSWAEIERLYESFVSK